MVHLDSSTTRAHAKAAGGSNARPIGVKPNTQKGDLNDADARGVKRLAPLASANFWFAEAVAPKLA